MDKYLPYLVTMVLVKQLLFLCWQDLLRHHLA